MSNRKVQFIKRALSKKGKEKTEPSNSGSITQQGHQAALCEACVRRGLYCNKLFKVLPPDAAKLHNEYVLEHPNENRLVPLVHNGKFCGLAEISAVDFHYFSLVGVPDKELYHASEMMSDSEFCNLYQPAIMLDLDDRKKCAIKILNGNAVLTLKGLDVEKVDLDFNAFEARYVERLLKMMRNHKVDPRLLTASDFSSFDQHTPWPSEKHSTQDQVVGHMNNEDSTPRTMIDEDPLVVSEDTINSVVPEAQESPNVLISPKLISASILNPRVDEVDSRFKAAVCSITNGVKQQLQKDPDLAEGCVKISVQKDIVTSLVKYINNLASYNIALSIEHGGRLDLYVHWKAR
jgi:hypothetical protein